MKNKIGVKEHPNGRGDHIVTSSKTDKLKITVKLANIAIGKFEVRLYTVIAAKLLKTESTMRLKILVISHET